MRLLPALLALAAACGPSPEAALSGRWTGAVVQGGDSLATVLDLRWASGRIKGRIRSPALLESAPVLDARYDAPRLRFRTRAEGAIVEFDGVHAGDSLVGTVRRGGAAARAVFRRAGDVPPEPYQERPARFPGPGASLAGTLLLPVHPGPHPAVVLVHGSGPSTRDDLRALADTFARAGIAALIYDKRGTGGSTGSWARDSFPHLAYDAASAVVWLKGQRGIDTARIGLWGGSEGAVVAPLAAEQVPVRFLVLQSTPGVTFGRQDLDRVAAQLRRRGTAEAEVAAAVENRRRAHALVRAGSPDLAAREALRAEARGRPWAREHGPPPAADPWWTWYGGKIDVDPTAALRRARVPVLVLMGGADDVVPPEPNRERVAAALAANTDAHVLLFPGADHQLRVRRPGGWPRYAPGALDAIITFARSRFGMRRAAPCASRADFTTCF